jgi:hypothetical protein
MKGKSILKAACGVLIVAVVGVAAVSVWPKSEPAVAKAQATMRLISTEQYVNSVQYVFGEDIEVRANFPQLQRSDGLISLGATSAAMTSGALEQFDRAARSIATQVTDESHRNTLVPCAPESAHAPDADCARQFFGAAGRLLFRRPLTADEADLYVEMADAAGRTAEDFYEGLSISLAGMLMAPQFLYITETVESDPSRAREYRLDSYSKATRLSLFLWNSLPDDALLAAAEAGELQDDGKISGHVERMLASPRLERGVRAFFGDWLRTREVEVVSKDPVIYPAFTFHVTQSVNEQTLRTVTDHLLDRHGDYRELFTSSRTFINRSIAPLYEAAVPAGASDEWVAYDMDANRSAGLLTSLGFLSAHAHPGRSSPTRRGMAIREIFLCQVVPEPPPTVDFGKFEELSGHKTARDRLGAHSSDPACMGCHKLTDPAGLALENFDGAGQFRTAENDTPIDTSADFDGRAVKDVTDLGHALSEHPGLAPCLTRRLYAYGIGRDPGKTDREWLAWMTGRFASHDYRFPELLREMAESDAFYAVAAPDGAST